MATSSIMKNVKLKDKRLITKFVSALEDAHDFEEKHTELKRPYTEVKQEDIKNIFKDML